MRSSNFIDSVKSSMKIWKNKLKKRNINWKNVMFQLHRYDLTSAFLHFVESHPGMSINRCAYFVLKKNYSTAALRLWKHYYETTDVSYSDLFSKCDELVHYQWVPL